MGGGAAAIPDSLAACRRLDRADPLTALSRRFRLPAGAVYLDGNSLGPLPRGAEAAVRRATTQEWGQSLVGGWNTDDWIGLPARTAARIAPLIGRRNDRQHTTCIKPHHPTVFHAQPPAAR